MPMRCPLHDPIPVETQQPQALPAFSAVLDPLGIEASRKAERERALLAQMAATIFADPARQCTHLEAVAHARKLLADVDGSGDTPTRAELLRILDSLDAATETEWHRGWNGALAAMRAKIGGER